MGNSPGAVDSLSAFWCHSFPPSRIVFFFQITTSSLRSSRTSRPQGCSEESLAREVQKGWKGSACKICRMDLRDRRLGASPDSNCIRLSVSWNTETLKLFSARSIVKFHPIEPELFICTCWESFHIWHRSDCYLQEFLTRWDRRKWRMRELSFIAECAFPACASMHVDILQYILCVHMRHTHSYKVAWIQ